MDEALRTSPPLLRDALKDPYVINAFSEEQATDPVCGKIGKCGNNCDDCTYTPAVCRAANSGNCSVQILHIAPTGYDEGKVEAMVEKLGIRAKIVYVGQKAHTSQLWTAYKKRSSSLIYSFYPNTNQYGISILNLPRAVIDPQLDFKPQQLRKLVWPGLADNRGADAVEFAKNFDLLLSDQSELSRLYDLFEDPQAAACVWVKENVAKWEELEKFPERKSTPFFCLPKKTPGLCNNTYFLGWVAFSLQLFFSLVIGFWAYYMRSPPRFRSDIREKINEAVQGSCEHSLSRSERSSFYKRVLGLTGNFQTHMDFLDDLDDIPRCLTHRRTFENFTQANAEPNLKMPPPGTVDRWQADIKRSTLYPYLFSSGGDGLKSVLILSLALGLLSGAASTLFYQIVQWQTYTMDPTAFAKEMPTVKPGTYYQTLKLSGDKFEQLIGVFVFFPSFLQIGYLLYAVERWRTFQDYGYNIMGALHSTALLIGSSIRDPHNIEAQKLAFRCYRYLTVIHIVTYKNLNPWFKELESKDLVALGLLTPEEVRLCWEYPEKHEIINGWIAKEMFNG